MKKSAAVRKAAKTPAAATLKKEISSDTRREASLKHDAATAKSAGTRKHDEARAAKLGKTIKSLKHQLASKSSGTKKRAWSPDADLGLCAARAVAESLRLSLGVCLTHDDVLGLHWAAGGDRNVGASILEALTVVRRQAGFRPVLAEDLLNYPALPFGQLSRNWRDPDLDEIDHCIGAGVAHPLILGLDLPWGEPHAVTYDPRDGTWWSWGEPYGPEDFPGAVIEEAWAVTRA